LFAYYFLNINFKLNQVIIITIISHKYIHILWGIIIKISLNFDKSELGHTLKSSIICSIVAIHKNCKIIESYFVFFAEYINIHEIKNNIRLEKIELNQKIQVKIIIQDNIYITISEIFCFFDQIYNNIFQNIALQIYHHIRTTLLKSQAVVANPLQLEFI